MAEWSLVDCEEMEGTQTESGSLQSRNPSVQLRCAWADRYDLVADVIGNARIWPYDNPANAFAPRAFDYEIETLGPKGSAVAGSPQLMDYESALVTINYQPLQLPSGPAPYTAFAEDFRPYMERFNTDHNSLDWDLTDRDGKRFPMRRDEAPGGQLPQDEGDGRSARLHLPLSPRRGSVGRPRL